MDRTVGGAGRRRRPTSRGGRPVLDPDRIARTGLGLLATEGAGALSMGRLARELGVTSRAIYHWIPSRRDLLEAVITKAQLSLPMPVSTGDWRDDLRRYRDDTFAWMDSFPGVTDLILSEGIAVVTPPVLRAQEAGLGLLCGAGLTPRQALVALSEFARWVGAAHRYLIAGTNPRLHDDIAAESGQATTADPESYPLIAAAGAVSIAEQLELGFAWLLESVARLAEEERPSPGGPAGT
jgi:AcrR family transcriptional regulator